jgi:hypothetical protein
VTGVTWGSERIEALLLHLTIIERLARDALPKKERAALPSRRKSRVG